MSQAILVIGKNEIRHKSDERVGKMFFSVVDVIDLLVKTSDSRNYWKVLKNRLKKTHFELVTRCNQLKMLSRDGKYYLTDVADLETMLDIANLIPGAKTVDLRDYLCKIGDLPEEGENKNTAELLVDAYQTDTLICIKAMVAGVYPDSLSVSVLPEKVTINGTRENLNVVPEKYYLQQELLWSRFSRTLELPARVESDKFEVNVAGGLLTITLRKIIQV